MKNLARIVMILGALSLLLVLLFPIWRITLIAPQYPDGITMFIWVNKITGDTESTLQNINILNHYVGMKKIEPDSIPELTYFPYVIWLMAGLGILTAFINRKPYYLGWVVLLAVLGGLGVYDFYLWEYDYGHNLDPMAPIKVPGMAYQPPLFGTKMLLNFEAISLPYIGSIFIGVAAVAGIIAFIIRPKIKKQPQKWEKQEKLVLQH